ncbi:hypothetical protein [Streptomyces sp. NPDC059262]|uniref:hypothetical protein n=1 Tax=Streptomyces sp. NPDC059262 TaxID=3346797 RepID=UPI0036C26C65
MFQLQTPSGTVTVQPTEPDKTGAVVYQLTGAVSGSVHVTISHHPHQWDQFTTVRVSLGSVYDLCTEPAEPLPRIRGRAYTGHGTNFPAEDYQPAEWREQWLYGPTGAPAPRQAAQMLTMVMRACGDHYRSRSDLSKLREQARRQQTPKLVGWLRDMISGRDRDEAANIAEAARDRAQGRVYKAAWWTVARWWLSTQDPMLLLLLSDGHGTFAHQARVRPQMAEVMDDSAREVRRRGDHFRGELEGLTRPRAGAAAGK